MITKEFQPNDSFGTRIFGAFLMVLELKILSDAGLSFPYPGIDSMKHDICSKN